MMNFLRNMPKDTRKWVMIAVLSVVIVSFVFFYGFDTGSATGDSFVVGKINGTAIYLSEYKRQYSAYSEMYKDQMNDDASRKETEKYVQQQAFNALLQKYFILGEAKRNRIAPSKFEILLAVANRKEFRTEDGRFNEDILRRMPTYYKRQLEQQYQEDLSQQLFQVRVANAAKVSDAEVREEYERLNTKVKVVYLKEETIQAQTNTLVPVGPSTGNRLERVLEKMKQGADFFASARSEGLSPQLTDWFSFGGRILKAGQTNEYCTDIESSFDAFKYAFAARRGMTSPIINLGAGRCLVAVVERREPDWTKFYEQAEEVKAGLLGQKMSEYFQQWFTTTIQKARIDSSGLTKLFGR